MAKPFETCERLNHWPQHANGRQGLQCPIKSWKRSKDCATWPKQWHIATSMLFAGRKMMDVRHWWLLAQDISEPPPPRRPTWIKGVGAQWRLMSLYSRPPHVGVRPEASLMPRFRLWSRCWTWDLSRPLDPTTSPATPSARRRQACCLLLVALELCLRLRAPQEIARRHGLAQLLP